MSVKLIYKDFAVGADEDAYMSESGAFGGSDVSLLPFGSGNEKNYATLELNSWSLDGSKILYDGGVVSFWSEELSERDCSFATPPSISAEFDNQYTSQGIYFDFDATTWCSSLRITWYRAGSVISQKTFYPDAATYFCENQVTAYDKVLIEIISTSLPHLRARIRQILFGIVREFKRDELRGVKIMQEIDPTSRNLPYSTLDWRLKSKKAVDFVFQKKQPIEVKDNNNLLGVFYIAKSDRLSEKTYDITCTDAIGVLEDSQFPDAVYTNKNAHSLAQEICDGFDLEMESSLMSKTVSGIVKGKSRRGALQQLCFAIGATATTDGTNKVRIFKLRTDGATEIPERRTRLGGSVKRADIVTAVKLTAHSYNSSGSGESVDIGGVTYYDTKTVTTIINPIVTATDKQNVIEIADATLISPSNVAEIAQLVYDYAVRRDTHKVKFRVDGERIGDYVTTHTNWGESVTGHYAKATIVLSGIVVSDAEVIGE